MTDLGSLPKVRIALVQMRSSLSVERNAAEAERLIRQAAASGADYVQTPENTLLMDLDRKRKMDAIVPEDRMQALTRMRDLACDLGIWLHLGSIAAKVADGRFANRTILIAPDGAVAARYDKVHMFDVDLPGGESYRESRDCAPGDAATIADLPFGRLGLTICYDLRFAALYAALAAAGATIMAIPSAFTRQTGAAHWHVLIRARAIETGSFVLAAAQCGHHEDGRDTFGHSLIVSPWGEVLAEAGEEPGVILADIDPSASAAARSRIPNLQHARKFTVPGAAKPGLRDAS